MKIERGDIYLGAGLVLAVLAYKAFVKTDEERAADAKDKAANAGKSWVEKTFGTGKQDAAGNTDTIFAGVNAAPIWAAPTIIAANLWGMYGPSFPSAFGGNTAVADATQFTSGQITRIEGGAANSILNPSIPAALSGGLSLTGPSFESVSKGYW